MPRTLKVLSVLVLGGLPLAGTACEDKTCKDAFAKVTAAGETAARAQSALRADLANTKAALASSEASLAAAKRELEATKARAAEDAALDKAGKNTNEEGRAKDVATEVERIRNDFSQAQAEYNEHLQWRRGVGNEQRQVQQKQVQQKIDAFQKASTEAMKRYEVAKQNAQSLQDHWREEAKAQERQREDMEALRKGLGP